jgi:hypothetical protein
MQKPRLTKTLSLDRDMARAIERMAKTERRSFTQQVTILLTSALERQNRPAPAEARG